MAEELKLYIEGKDMTNDIGVISAVHDTYAADYVDSIVCGLQDKDGKWSKWKPKAGEELQLNVGTCKTGKMWIHKVTSTNGIYYVTARSIPPYKNSVQTREWDGTTFLSTASSLANELGLSFENHGCADHSYNRLYQLDEKNTAFFRRLCHMESVEMTIFDGKLIAYDEDSIEHGAPSKKITFTGEGDFSFTRGEGDRVGSVRVMRTVKENHAESARTDEYDDERIVVDQTATKGEGRKITYTRLKPTDDTEALRWAQGLLKNANKYNSTGKFILSLQTDLAAGSVIEIQNDRASEWNGSVFLYRVKHDYKAQASTMYFRALSE